MALVEKSGLGVQEARPAAGGACPRSLGISKEPGPLEQKEQMGEKQGGDRRGKGGHTQGLVGYCRAFGFSQHEMGAYTIGLFYALQECILKVSDRIS